MAFAAWQRMFPIRKCVAENDYGVFDKVGISEAMYSYWVFSLRAFNK